MKHALAALALLTAGTASAGLLIDKMEIAAGTLTVKPGALLVNDETIYEDARIAIFDLGEAGVLVQGDHGGKQCPFTYHVVNKDTGALRELNPNSDRSTLFAECERLVDIVPSLGTVIFAGRTTGEVASVWAWNGETMAQAVIDRAATPEPVAKAEGLAAWEGRYLFELLTDTEGRAHLATALRPEELTHADLVAHSGGAIERDGDYLIGGACHSTDCDWRWVMVALRLTDGAVFALLAEDGIDVIKPEGEDLPDALVLALEMGELP